MRSSNVKGESRLGCELVCLCCRKPHAPSGRPASMVQIRPHRRNPSRAGRRGSESRLGRTLPVSALGQHIPAERLNAANEHRLETIYCEAESQGVPTILLRQRFPASSRRTSMPGPGDICPLRNPLGLPIRAVSGRGAPALEDGFPSWDDGCFTRSLPASGWKSMRRVKERTDRVSATPAM